MVEEPGSGCQQLNWLGGALAQAGIDNNNKGMTDGRGGRKPVRLFLRCVRHCEMREGEKDGPE